MTRLFDRFDEPALAAFFEEAGALEVLRERGFDHFAVAIADRGLVWPHVLLHAEKAGRTHLLLEASLRRLTMAFPALDAGPVTAPLDLLLVSWLREEDPTVAFGQVRPPLPLQRHPGLGVLRRAFWVAVRIAAELESDGIANQPKFFHDAVIFQRAAQFLFLDSGEQGRFEALRRDLTRLALRDASLAVAAWCVRDAAGRTVRWCPGFQIHPLSARLRAYVSSADYAAAVAAERSRAAYRVDAGALPAAQAQCRDAST